MLRFAMPAVMLALLPLPAYAQDEQGGESRWRVALGPQVVPQFPGADGVAWRPFVEVDRARGDEAFEFEAPDETFGFSLVKAGGLGIGPSLGIEGKRRSRDLGAPVQDVGFTVEVGGFVQYYPLPQLRLRAEARRGIGGHKAWIGAVSADWVLRDGDRWLISAGPRVTIGSDRYHRAYFGVTAADAAASGLPAFRPSGGVQAAGATLGAIRQLSRRWNVHGYVRYDRLVGDAAQSPITRALGSRDQYAGGLALSYTFGKGLR